MRDFSDDLKALRARLAEAQQYLSIDAARPRLAELEQQASAQDLWDDPDRARQVTSEMSNVKGDVDLFDDLAARIEDAETLDELAREEGDESQEGEIAGAIADLVKRFDDLELRALFSGEYDDSDAI